MFQRDQVCIRPARKQSARRLTEHLLDVDVERVGDGGGRLLEEEAEPVPGPHHRALRLQRVLSLDVHLQTHQRTVRKRTNSKRAAMLVLQKHG